MFLKILGVFSFLLIINCNKGKVDLEQCGCRDGGNRRQYLVTARVNSDQIGELIRTIVDFEEGIGGGGGDYNRVRVDGVCVEMETSRVVFCAEDRRDYEGLENEFPDIRFQETPVN